ncbi:MAG: DAK2 domain-containing protein [Christensenellales bacterium]
MQEKLNGELLKDMIFSAAALLEQNKKGLNALNVFPVPDGDTGTNMSLTMMSAVKEVKSADSSKICNIGDALSLGALKGARGNSGVILSQLFRGISKGLQGLESATPADFARAMQDGVDAAYKAVMRPKEGTILTVAKDMAKTALKNAARGDNIYLMLDTVLEQGAQTLRKTPDMLPVLKEAGVVDAGGKGLLIIYRGFKMALDGEAITDSLVLEPEATVDFSAVAGGEELEFGYCTEFFIKNIHESVTQYDIDRYREKLMKIGDCVLVVGDLQLVKTHVHTNVPGKALQFALRFGELSRIKIDNMREQHTELSEADPHDRMEKKKMAMVTVAAGEGIINIFKEFLVDEIVEGGQTMNPSAETISNAIESAPSDNVFVFPNNKNIILAAEQAARFSDKNVHVIPSRSIPQGISGVLAYNPDLDFEENTERMEKAINSVKTGQVTYAIRESRINGHTIKKGEIIGILDGEITCHSGDMFETCEKLLFGMIDEDNDSIITIFYGEDVTEDLAKQMSVFVEKKYSEYDIELQFGGQPVYPFVFAVE